MPTINESLRDESIAHSVWLSRYATGVANRMVRLLNETDADLSARLLDALDRLPPESFTVKAVSVKAPWKYGPYETTEEAFKRRGRSVDEFSEVIGTDVADATLEGYVKYGLKALTAAIGANADMVVTADIETDGKKTLTRGLRKYGDKFNRVVLFVMHSAPYFDIVDEAIANKIYEEAGVVVYGGQPGTLGKPVLVTDTMDADAILGLVAGAVTFGASRGNICLPRMVRIPATNTSMFYSCVKSGADN